MSKRQRIRNPKDNFTIMPNMYDNDDLTVYEFRLLIHYRRVGNCYESLRTTAQKCHMGKSTVERARRSLAEKGWIVLGSTSKGTIAVDVIDRWTSTPIYRGTVDTEQNSPPVGQIKTERWTYSDFIREKGKGINSQQCVYCGRPVEVLDHWVSSSHGGSDDDENLVASCSICNSAKGEADGDEFVKVYIERGWIADDHYVSDKGVPQRRRLSQRDDGCPRDNHEEVLIKKDSLISTKDLRSKTKRNTNNRVRKALEEQFTDSTRLKSPPMNTMKQKKAAGELWWAPLREIAELAELDILRGQSLIRRTVEQMRKDKLTISSPKSIVNVAKSIIAEGTGRSISGAREFLNDLRRTTN